MYTANLVIIPIILDVREPNVVVNMIIQWHEGYKTVKSGVGRNEFHPKFQSNLRKGMTTTFRNFGGSGIPAADTVFVQEI